MMAVNMKNQEVSLGCGTLILIALIVMIFGGRDTNDLERKIDNLRGEIVELKQAVEAQTKQVELLQDKLNQLVPPQ
jgi:uncharacterized protein YoxC